MRQGREHNRKKGRVWEGEREKGRGEKGGRESESSEGALSSSLHSAPSGSARRRGVRNRCVHTLHSHTRQREQLAGAARAGGTRLRLCGGWWLAYRGTTLLISPFWTDNKSKVQAGDIQGAVLHSRVAQSVLRSEWLRSRSNTEQTESGSSASVQLFLPPARCTPLHLSKSLPREASRPDLRQ